MLITIVFVVLLAGLVVVTVRGFQARGAGGTGGRGSGGGGLGGGRGRGAGYAQGTLTVTGVSDRPDADSKGQAFCTVSGTIVGPGTAPTEVYGQMILDQGQPWPYLGSDHPVVYKPGKAESSWQFGALPPQDPQSPTYEPPTYEPPRQ
ncbi:MAG: hypothetical protein QM673_06945 [Gordonia sp. (in: high G+C Gram-positive bacteria)]